MRTKMNEVNLITAVFSVTRLNRYYKGEAWYYKAAMQL